MDKLFKEVVSEEDQTKTYEEVTVFKAFDNEEDYNKTLQSASSKAKGDILGELGIKSVSEFKEKFSSVGDVESLKTQLVDKESLLTEKTTALSELNTKYNEAVTKRDGLEEQIVLTKYAVPDTFKNDFKVLVKAGVAEDKTFEQSAEEVYKRLNITQVKNKILIGGDKNTIKPIELKEKMIKYRDL